MAETTHPFSTADVVAVKSSAQQARSSVTRESGYPQARNMAGFRVLISDEHYKHTLGIVRHLGRLGASVSIVARSRKSLACRSRYCRQVIPAPDGNLETLVQTVLEAIRKQQFDLVIPVSYPVTLALARRALEIAQYSHLELAESEAIEIAANKLKMINLAGTLGVPAPATYLSTEIPKPISAMSFPVVIKPQMESPGRQPVRYARNAADLERMLSRKPGGGGVPYGEQSYLLQEFIPGQGCGFFASYQRGVCKRIFMHRRVREYPASGGASSCAESFYDAKLEMYGRRMLDALDWHGVAMVEFRRDSRDGEYKLMEINPKFWGSLDLALAAGADFPGDLCRMARGTDLPFSEQYERDLRFQWPFSGHGDLFHLWTRPQSIWNVARDFLNPRVKSNVWASDFAPNLQELRGLGQKLFRKKKE